MKTMPPSSPQLVRMVLSSRGEHLSKPTRVMGCSALLISRVWRSRQRRRGVVDSSGRLASSAATARRYARSRLTLALLAGEADVQVQRSAASSWYARSARVSRKSARARTSGSRHPMWLFWASGQAEMYSVDRTQPDRAVHGPISDCCARPDAKRFVLMIVGPCVHHA